ncbi:MAG: sugar ABC transporter substrate-binding protein [Deltaproteobacteria bacterium]|nr:sugar ABC transporter substrate-binding protein [Deltaproteobacteria bacterium]
MISEFESLNPDVKVEVEYIGWKDRQAKMTAAMASGTEPEVALLSSQYATSLPAQGALARMDDVMVDLGGPEAFYGAALSLASYEGHFYSIPYSMLPVVIWYRKDRFDRIGLRPPETLSDFYEAAKLLHEKSGGKYFALGTPYGRGEYTDETFRALALWPMGGSVFDKKGKVVFDSPVTARALSFYKSLYPFTPPGSETWGYSDTMKSFVSGSCAMTIYFGRTLKNLQQYNPEILPKTGAMLPPKGEYQRTVNPPQSIGVFRNSKYPELGKKFVKFFFTSDQYVRFLWATPGHNVPVLKAKAAAWRQNELLQKYPEIVKVLLKACDPKIGFSPTKPPGNPVASPYWQPIRGSRVIPDAVQRVTLKNEDPEKVAKWAAEKIRQIMAEFKL